MKVAIAVPWRSDDGGRRDQLWAHTRKWLETNHPGAPIYQGESPPGPFNRGAAINHAAAQAGRWDVLVVHDADNISHPDTLGLAVDTAWRNATVIFPFETYIYLDGPSTDALLADANWFVCPYKGDKGYAETVKFHHYSGIQAISRPTWDRVGGFISLPGWGAEDAIMEQLFETFAGGVDWLHGSAYHLFHEPQWYTQPAETASNRRIYAHILQLRKRGDAKTRIRQYLKSIGHPIP